MQEKSIEYYFENYIELTAIRLILSGRENCRHKIFIPKTAIKCVPRKISGNLDAETLYMLDIVEKTYFHFEGTKRDVLRLKYFKKMSRADICRKLQIEMRTYHRYVKEFSEYASWAVAIYKMQSIS